VLKAKRFMGDSLAEAAAEPNGIEYGSEEMAQAAGSPVAHPLHHIRPEVE
jgi:hypothetical protein